MSALKLHKTISVGASISILILMASLLRFPNCFFPSWIAPSEVSELLFSPSDDLFAAVLKHPQSHVLFRIIVVNRHSNTAILDTNGMWPTNISFDDQGRYFAVQWADALRIYKLSTGRCISSIKRQEFDHRKYPERGLSSMAFSDDGQSIILASDQWADTPMEAAWDVYSGLLTENKRPASIWNGPGLAPDRTKWFVGGWPGPSPRVLDRKDGHFIAACVHNSFPIFASFTRDSENVLTVHKNGDLIRWDLRDSGRGIAAIAEMERHTGLERCHPLALLNRSDSLAYFDSQRKLRFRKLFQ